VGCGGGGWVVGDRQRGWVGVGGGRGGGGGGGEGGGGFGRT